MRTEPGSRGHDADDDVLWVAVRRPPALQDEGPLEAGGRLAAQDDADPPARLCR